MKQIYLITAMLCVVTFLNTGCTTTEARRVDPNGGQNLTSSGRLDIQDATDAAGELSQSLLESGILGSEGRPSIIAISRYINNTRQQIDRDRIIKKIRVSLNKAGVAQTLTTVGMSGTAEGSEDTFATNKIETDKFLNNKKSIDPEYTLTLKILDERAKAGRDRQVTYIFQMSLTDISTGLAVWEDERRISKITNKASVGW